MNAEYVREDMESGSISQRFGLTVISCSCW